MNWEGLEILEVGKKAEMILTWKDIPNRIRMKFNRNKYSEQLGEKKENLMQIYNKCKNAEDCMQVTEYHRSKTGLAM